MLGFGAVARPAPTWEPPAVGPGASPTDEEAHLLARLRRGDERAFTALVDAYTSSLLHVAQGFVRTHAVAEEVVQETWLAVLSGIDRFEGRSSLRTWIFRILTNKAKTRGEREARSVPFSTLEGDEGEPVVPEDRFRPAEDRWAGHWASPPRPVPPEARLLSAELRGRLEDALAALPPAQRIVVSLRDVEGWDAAEVCEALGLSEGNQRVLLHRGRSKLRAALEQYVEDES